MYKLNKVPAWPLTETYTYKYDSARRYMPKVLG